jgi:hypothetical protein
LLEIDITPVLVPLALGTNWALKVQLAPTARLAPQVPALPDWKSPLKETVPKLRTALPVFLIVTYLTALTLPTRTVPKFSELVEGVATGAETTPIPDSEITAGELASLLLKLKLPVRAADAVGLKARLMTQLAPEAIGAVAQVPPLANWKSPVIVHAEPRIKGAVPTLVKVIV